MIRKCADGHYTMRETCHGEKSRVAHPPKFSLADKYAKYRRMATGTKSD